MIKRTHKESAGLFEEPPSRPERFAGAYQANIDGAARGNPGPASYGVAFRRPDGSPLESLGRYIGRQTNNAAEYYALIAALDYAAAKGIKRLRVQSDSQLIVNQMNGVYKVKHPDLRPLHERAKKQAATLEAFEIKYVPREQNKAADALANAALDNTSGVNAGNAPAHDPAHKLQPKTPAGSHSEPRTEPHSETRASLSSPRKIRARFRDGVLVPNEPLGFGEDEELEITIERSPRR